MTAWGESGLQAQFRQVLCLFLKWNSFASFSLNTLIKGRRLARMFLCLSRFDCIHENYKAYIFIYFRIFWDGVGGSYQDLPSYTKHCLWHLLCFALAEEINQKGTTTEYFLVCLVFLTKDLKHFKALEVILNTLTALQAIPEHSLSFKVWLTKLERWGILGPLCQTKFGK